VRRDIHQLIVIIQQTDRSQFTALHVTQLSSIFSTISQRKQVFDTFRNLNWKKMNFSSRLYPDIKRHDFTIWIFLHSRQWNHNKICWRIIGTKMFTNKNCDSLKNHDQFPYTVNRLAGEENRINTQINTWKLINNETWLVIHGYIHTNMHTHIHIHMHTHTHTQTTHKINKRYTINTTPRDGLCLQCCQPQLTQYTTSTKKIIYCNCMHCVCTKHMFHINIYCYIIIIVSTPFLACLA